MQLALFLSVSDLHPVDAEQSTHDPNIADVRNVPKDAGGLTEKRRDHRLRDEVLRALEFDPTGERASAPNGDCVCVKSHAGPRPRSVLEKSPQCDSLMFGYLAGKVCGRHAARLASNAVIASSLRSVSAMSSSPSSKRHLV